VLGTSGAEICCIVDCEKLADWAIYTEVPYSDTYACTEHVGALLSDAPVHSIYHYLLPEPTQAMLEDEIRWARSVSHACGEWLARYAPPEAKEETSTERKEVNTCRHTASLLCHRLSICATKGGEAIVRA